jgi:hypothetical protein
VSSILLAALGAVVVAGAPDPVANVVSSIARLEGCPSLQAKAGRSYARFELTSSSVLVSARLFDLDTGAEVANDCLRRLGTRPAVAGGARQTVWWPLEPAGTTGGELPLQVPGVDLLVVPQPYVRSDLPNDLANDLAPRLDGTWLGLCGPRTTLSSPREVTLTRDPDLQTPGFDDIGVVGCGTSAGRWIPVFRGPALHAGAKPARVVRAPGREVVIRSGGARYRVRQLRLPGRGSVLVLGVGAISQVLATDGDPASDFDVMWAGDLDRDGRLDLLIRDDADARYRLFLSRAHLLPALLAAQTLRTGD